MSDHLNDLLLAFVESLKVRNYSPASIRAYTYNLRRFLGYLKEQKIADIRKVNRSLLQAYQIQITPRYGVSTVSIMIRAVKRFFAYLEEINQILINPAEQMREPKKETRFPRVVLTEEEVRKILDAPNLSMLTGIRDRAVLEVFYSTGIRLEELVHLTIFDGDLQGGRLRVNKGKMAKDRVIPLGKHAVRFLKEYITRVRPHHTRRDKAIRHLFVSQRGTPLTGKMIQRMVGVCAAKAGITKPVTPHVFRHTFATQLIKNGADIRAVQKMLGHARLSVTHIYTRVAGVEVKKTHKDHHPREKDKTTAEDPTPRIERVKGRSHRKEKMNNGSRP